MPVKQKRKTSIALGAAMIGRLDRLGKAAGVSRSELIRDLIEGSLEQAEMMVKVTSDPVMMGAVGQVLSDPAVLRQMVSGLRQELSQEQLDLFQARVEQMSDLSSRGQRKANLARKAQRRAK
jgi:metal-responsive CopG/Arc/MetJ family transcriptional regulator